VFVLVVAFVSEIGPGFSLDIQTIHKCGALEDAEKVVALKGRGFSRAARTLFTPWL
jgi:hypothetical protein